MGREKEALWVRALPARYGMVDISGWALGEDVEKSGSQIVKAWWSLGQGRNLVGNMSRDKLRHLVGKGGKTLFWKNLWFGDRLIKDVFPRLYRIVKNKHTLAWHCYKV